ncbi:hypothetical protein BHYA_0098g00020 [Botrytis hyacinthi]|uniref:Uncharacterized protein n=1 Tax=Botrytis hyacinthi TaxID=278943 RepID=A0A4Z1GPM9_9HELO|nr:hypothetical protein BHYA_0098g00020 [Botrytis hyacinthi]
MVGERRKKKEERKKKRMMMEMKTTMKKNKQKKKKNKWKKKWKKNMDKTAALLFDPSTYEYTRPSVDIAGEYAHIDQGQNCTLSVQSNNNKQYVPKER